MTFPISEEHQLYKDTVERFVAKEMPKDWARELERKEDEYPFALWDKMTEGGFHALGVPEEYGGAGGDVMMQVILARAMARTLSGLAWLWGINQFAGVKTMTMHGNEAQKKRFLPDIAAGRLRAAISLTEPGGGTDVLGAMRTFGARADGGWVINGEKIWSSQSHVADYLLVLARTDKNVKKNHHGLTLFWVPAKTKGITIRPLKKLGMRSMGSCIVTYDSVFVEEAGVIGEPGSGWSKILPMLNNERLLMSANCLGYIDGVLEDALDYAKQRKAFGHTIGEFQIIQHYIADMKIAQYTVECLLMDCARKAMEGTLDHMSATILKTVAAESSNRCADLGIQILGGMGYSAETDMQRYWRDSRLQRIGPVTDEMCRNMIAEQLGLPRSF